MTFVSLSDLLDDLTFKAQIQLSGSESYFSGRLESVLVEAAARHNSSYTLSNAASTVPAREKRAVVLLAWAEVCRIRATVWANDPNISGASGYGSDRATPYRKNMDLAESLEKQYGTECSSLELTSYANAPKVSDLVTRDAQLGAISELNVAPAPPAVSLSVTTPSGGEAVLTVTFPRFLDFYMLGVLYLEGADPIIQNWNFASPNGVPRTHNSAEVVHRSFAPDQTQFKVTGVSAVQGTTVRFLVFLSNRNSQFSYSNEVTFVIP